MDLGHQLDLTRPLANPALDAGVEEMQRLFSCMIGSAGAESLAQEAVLGMEMDLFRKGWPVGLSLGAMQDVQKRFGLGRPASHAAIKILEARGLLDVRRGPGGGVFVAAPVLEDVAGAVLVQLALSGATLDCLVEFRLLVWRMIVDAAIRKGIRSGFDIVPDGEWGFAEELANQVGNTSMVQLARLAETLMRISESGLPQACDPALEAAIGKRDIAAALARLDVLAGPIRHDTSEINLEVAERAFSLSGRKSAMALAAQMVRELSGNSGAQEAEWETADRLGYTDSVVRQARRILQDFGMVRCRQGRKGAELVSDAPPTGVIRLLASFLVVNASLQVEKLEAISYLVSSAPVIAARQVRAAGTSNATQGARVSMTDVVDALTLENLLVEMSGNPLLEIVVRSLGLSNLFIASVPLVPPNLGDMVEINRQILHAIEGGNVEAAEALARTKFDLMQIFARDERWDEPHEQ